MKKKDTVAILIYVRKILTEIMANADNDKFMRMRLAISLKIINGMISAQRASQDIHNRIKATRNQKRR